jgi:hypothetical protein
MGYVLDAEGTDNLDALRERGLAMELHRASIKWNDNRKALTDHNGFFWIKDDLGDIPLALNNRLKVVGENNQWMVNSYDNEFYEGTYGTFFDGGTMKKTARVNIIKGAQMFVVPNRNSGTLSVTEFKRTRILGQVVDADDNPIPNVLVLSTRTGRFAKTDSTGRFILLIYADGTFAIREDDIIVNSIEGCKLVLTQYFRSYSILLNSSSFNNTTPFDIGIFKSTSAHGDKASYLKRGGIYPWGIIYEDRGNRKFPLARRSSDVISIPFHTETGYTASP